MKFEKSCGAIVFRKGKHHIEYLLVFNKKGMMSGHWGFPKGHVEGNEAEQETAIREIREETGLSVRFVDGFRKVIQYAPKPGVKKDVVYFLAKAKSDEVQIQLSEIADYRWTLYEEAMTLLPQNNNRDVMMAAHEFLDEHKK